MNKTNLKNCIIASVTAFLAVLTGGIFAMPLEKTTAKADTQLEDLLLIPSSPEEYLSLTNPSCIALSNNYTAIAEQNKIHIYSHVEQTYLQPVFEVEDRVTDLSFTNDGTLYYSTANDGNNLFAYPIGGEKNSFSTHCQAFFVDEEALYFVDNFVDNSGNIKKTNRQNYALQHTQTLVENVTHTPTLHFSEDKLYYTDGGKTLRAEGATFFKPLTDTQTVSSLVVLDNVAYFTDTENVFHIYDLQTDILQSFDDKQYLDVYSYNTAVYTVANTQILRYSPTENTFDGFEISTNSSATNRLSQATALYSTAKALYTLDTGNSRVSVYDKKAKSYTTFSITQGQKFLSADDKTFLVADSTTATLYDLESNQTKTFNVSPLDGQFTGATNVYGKYYLTTTTNKIYTYTWGDATPNVWALTNPTFANPSLITHDAYGILYLLTANNSVQAFTETDLITQTEGQVKATLPYTPSQIALDYAQNVYVLKDKNIYNVTQDISHSPNPKINGDITEVNGFSFSIEDDVLYMLCNGNLICSTSAFDLPTPKNIKKTGLDDFFATESAEYTTVEILPSAVLIEFDLSTLPSTETFPYIGIRRSSQSHTALKIGETDDYTILALFDVAKNGYQTYLAKKGMSLYTETENPFYQPFLSPKTGYVTNAIPLYKFPYFTSLLTVTTLPKNTQISLLGSIKNLDCDYYKVSYTDTSGTTQIGFIPENYVNDFYSQPTPPTDYTVGETQSNTDSVYRLIYIVLGCAIIGILINYLLLRKKED